MRYRNRFRHRLAIGGRGYDGYYQLSRSFDRIYASNKNLAYKEYDLIIDFDPD